MRATQLVARVTSCNTNTKLRCNTCCQVLVWQKNGVQAAPFAVIFKQKNDVWEFLQTIRLSRNYLSDKAAESLARIFWGNMGITTLDLSNNHIGERGAIALARGLKRIKDIGITDRGILHVALSRNSFGDRGVKKILHAVNVTGNVHTIKMEGVRYVVVPPGII